MRRRRTKQACLELIEGFADSDLTVAVYCARIGIPVSSFYHWRALLDEERSHSSAPVKSSSVKSSPAPLTVSQSMRPFLDLGTLGSAQSRVELRLELGAGVVIHLVRS